MRHALLISGALCLLIAAPVRAGGINSYWSTCGSGPTFRTFTCDTNVGTNDIVASFDPPQSASDVTGAIGVIDLCLAGVNLAPWWQLGTGGCRETALSALAIDVGATTQCSDLWQGNAGTNVGYIVGYSGWDSARILVFVAALRDLTFPVATGTEYHAFTVRIKNTATTGDGSCFGCSYPACIVLNEIRVTAAQSGDQVITNPLANNFLMWQSYVPNCPFIVPVQNRTWGQLKASYR